MISGDKLKFYKYGQGKLYPASKCFKLKTFFNNFPEDLYCVVALFVTDIKRISTSKGGYYIVFLEDQTMEYKYYDFNKLGFKKDKAYICNCYITTHKKYGRQINIKSIRGLEYTTPMLTK